MTNDTKHSVWARLKFVADRKISIVLSANDVAELFKHRPIAHEIEEQFRIENESAQQRQEPKYAPGTRVMKKGEPDSGRVQAITYHDNGTTFRYLVKWDTGPTTTHPETALAYEPLPTHYP